MKIAVEEFLSKQNINDDLFYSSLVDELEEIIEDEVSKDVKEMDTELIDDCCVAIENLKNVLSKGENESYDMLLGAESIIKKYNRKLRSVYISSVTCAAVAVLCAITLIKQTNNNSHAKLSLNNFFDSVFNIYEHTFTNPKIDTTEDNQTTNAEKETTTLINNETSEPAQTENQSTTEIDEITVTKPTLQIYKIVACPPPGFKTEFSDVSKIDLKRFLVRVYYSDNTVKNISINECYVEIGNPDKNGRTKITITYNQMYTSIYVNVRSEKEKNPVTLNSIYGSFNGKYNLHTMRVYAVYSDGTEKEIPEGEYTVSVVYSEDFEATIAIVEYGGCSFQFIPQV